MTSGRTLRIAYAGTPAFAATGLAALLDAGFDVGLVLSQPDRPAGRGQRLQASPVKVLASARGIPVFTPASLRTDRGGDDAVAVRDRLRALTPDVLVVAAYGLLLPEDILRLPQGIPVSREPGIPSKILPDPQRVTAINIHASLLPRWRGAAPVVRAIESGDTRTGITIMQMDAGLDTGPMLHGEAIDIPPDISAGMLTERLAELGGRLVVDTLRALARGEIRPQPQPDEGITYAAKVHKREAWLDWRESGERLAARVRAFDPFPGTCGDIAGEIVKFWGAHPVAAHPAAYPASYPASYPAAYPPHSPLEAAIPAPGTVLAADAGGLVVATGDGALCITRLQRPGGRRIDAREFLAAVPVPPGTVLASHPVTDRDELRSDPAESDPSATNHGRSNHTKGSR